MPSRAKAVNHWASDGSGKDPNATIKNCPFSHTVPGLVTWARDQNALKFAARENQKTLDQMQMIRDSAEEGDDEEQLDLEGDQEQMRITPVNPGALTKAASGHLPPTNLPKKPTNLKEQLQFTAVHIQKLERAIANHMVEDAEALVVHQKPAFREVVNQAISFGAAIGKGVFKHVGKKRMRDAIIPDVISRQDETTEMKAYDRKVNDFGSTLVSDGKDDVAKDHLINYVTVTPEGYRWESCQDVSGIRRRSEWVSADLLSMVKNLEDGRKKRRRLHESGDPGEPDGADEVPDLIPDLVGYLEGLQEELAGDDEADLIAAENRAARELVNTVLRLSVGDALHSYVQVVTDTPSVNAKAWALIEAESPHLLANPCIFHCINLHFKHLLKGDKSVRSDPQAPIPEFVELEAWTKELEQFFTNVETPHSCLRKECEAEWPSKGPRRMRKYSDTRAANSFKVWHRAGRLYSNKILTRAVSSQQFLEWESSIPDADGKARCKLIREILADVAKWDFLSKVVAALTPGYKLLRRVDGFTPAVGKVYYGALRVQEHYNELVEKNPDDVWCQRVRGFWRSDWNYMHVDLHSLGFCVDPEYHSHLSNMSNDVWEEFIRCAQRMLKAAPTSCGYTIDQLTSEYAQYQNLTNSYTDNVLEKARNMPAHLWWQQWGRSTPALRFVAMRALSQTVSASCSEQAWSEYDFIHSRRRNRLKKNYASLLVRGHNRARLIRRLRKVSSTEKFHGWTDSDDDDEEAHFSD